MRIAKTRAPYRALAIDAADADLDVGGVGALFAAGAASLHRKKQQNERDEGKAAAANTAKREGKQQPAQQNERDHGEQPTQRLGETPIISSSEVAPGGGQ